jgi:phospholipase A2
VLAAEWAKLNKFPFPEIDPTVIDREGFKECYVFENPDDPNCPIVMHFILYNNQFRKFKSPGNVDPCIITLFIFHSLLMFDNNSFY